MKRSIALLLLLALILSLTACGGEKPEIQNETDIPFTPDQLTYALFSEGKMYSVINVPGSLVQEWMGAESFVKGESSLSYRDAACLQPVDQMGLRLTGTDAQGNELTFAVLVDLAQEPEQ